MIEQIQNQIKSIALSRIPSESCGLVVENMGEPSCFECANIAEDKSKNFVIEPKDYLKASRFGKIVAMFHSQPSDFNEGESQLDILNSKNHKIKSIIYSWKSDSFFEIDPENVKIKDYFNVPFEIGKNDCFSLIRNYYKNELNINISDYPRNDNWIILTPSIIEDNYVKEGFLEVNMRSVQKHDILLFSFDQGNGCHMGIYTGDGMFLHHPRNRFAAIEFLNRAWSSKIKSIFRHKTLMESYGKD